MEIFKTLIGNDDIKNTLGTAVASGSFSHAYIIEGAYGTGKKMVAKLASAGILCESNDACPCGVCRSCQRVLNDLHTDVRFFEITKVDQVRAIKQELYNSPNECDYKIYIIENAHKMNVKAQNALLISLEEPPKNVIFFLLTPNAGTLLETIRSRAQILKTSYLEKDVIFNHLKSLSRSSLSDERLEEIVVASAGSLGYAIDLLDEEKSQELLTKRQLALDLVLDALRDDGESVTHMLTLSSMPREELKDLISLSLEVLGDIMLVKKNSDASLYFFTAKEKAISIAKQYKMERLSACHESFFTAISDLNMNCNSALTLMSILTNIKKKGK